MTRNRRRPSEPIPRALFEEIHRVNTSGWTLETCQHWEMDFAAPALRVLGYSVGEFDFLYTEEGAIDPFLRGVIAEKGGRKYLFYYQVLH